MTRVRLLALVGLAVTLAAGPARAQSTFTTPQANNNATGVVNMCLDTSRKAVPCSSLVPLPVQVTSGFPPSPLLYPPGSIPITGIATGTTGAVVGTLAAAGAKTTYIGGFDVSAIGGTATIGPITIANLNGGTFTYQYASSATGVLLSRTFTPCIPAATPGLAITITTTADGTATAVDVNAWGFQL